MRTTGLLPIEQQAMEASGVQFDAARMQVIQELTNCFRSRPEISLQQPPIWHKYMFGDRTFRDDLALSAGTVKRVFEEEESETGRRLHDTVCKDLLVHVVTWLAWRRVVEEQTPTTGFAGSVGDSYSTPSSEMLVASAAATAELDDSGSGVPPQPPDTTGPVQQPSSITKGVRRLFGGKE